MLHVEGRGAEPRIVQGWQRRIDGHDVAHLGAAVRLGQGLAVPGEAEEEAVVLRQTVGVDEPLKGLAEGGVARVLHDADLKPRAAEQGANVL